MHTSDTIMRIDELPERLVVVGGGYIAAEFAHVFASFGVRVTQLVRGSRLLRHHDADIATTFTDYTQQRYDLRRDTDVCGIKPSTAAGDGVSVIVEGPYGETHHRCGPDPAGHRPATELRPAEPAGHRGDDQRRSTG